ncbi:hypothetical protein ABIA39_007506 [Nocardia sp. GAS34]|uniref:hypothetical protein n=1 Tax=unclassified Nocardia TaxID=2637762 RepID=UPI003D21EE3C
MANNIKPESVVEAFVLRARRIGAHSLFRQRPDLMEKLSAGNFDVTVIPDPQTGKHTYRLRIEHPDEEALESLASRVRPVILSSEPIYYESVLRALETLVGRTVLDSVIDVDWWYETWAEAVDGSKDAQAYCIVTEAGAITDRKLMYAWLYGDVVHAKAMRSPAIQALGINERYYAAAACIARICDRVASTSVMIMHLADLGLLQLNSHVIHRGVVVTNTTVDRLVDIRTAEIGVDLPSDVSRLDPTTWVPLADRIQTSAAPDDTAHSAEH